LPLFLPVSHIFNFSVVLGLTKGLQKLVDGSVSAGLGDSGDGYLGDASVGAVGGLLGNSAALTEEEINALHQKRIVRLWVLYATFTAVLFLALLLLAVLLLARNLGIPVNISVCCNTMCAPFMRLLPRPVPSSEHASEQPGVYNSKSKSSSSSYSSSGSGGGGGKSVLSGTAGTAAHNKEKRRKVLQKFSQGAAGKQT
jgi:hypothetical protein